MSKRYATASPASVSQVDNELARYTTSLSIKTSKHESKVRQRKALGDATNIEQSSQDTKTPGVKSKKKHYIEGDVEVVVVTPPKIVYWESSDGEDSFDDASYHPGSEVGNTSASEDGGSDEKEIDEFSTNDESEVEDEGYESTTYNSKYTDDDDEYKPPKGINLPSAYKKYQAAKKTHDQIDDEDYKPPPGTKLPSLSVYKKYQAKKISGKLLLSDSDSELSL